MPVVFTFDEVLFPSDLPEAGTTGGTGFHTTQIRAPSGLVQFNANRLDGVGLWQVNCPHIEAGDVEFVNTFFRARFGMARGFRFRAPEDYRATLEVFDTSDGTVGPYQLTKSYISGPSGDVRKIVKPVAGGLEYDTRVNTVTIYVGAGNTPTAATVSSTTGLVTFAVAPTNGAVLKWSGEFDVPVHFNEDRSRFTFDTAGVSSFQAELEELLPPTLGL